MNILKASIILLCLLFSLTKSDKAQAAYSCNTNVYNSYTAGCDQGTAYTQCQAARSAQLGQPTVWVVAPTCTLYSSSGAYGSYKCEGRNASNNLSYCDGAYAYYTYSGGQCSARNTSYNGGVQDFKHIHNGTPQTCIAGCEIQHTGTVNITSALGTPLSTTASSSYTGLVCGSPLPTPSKQYTAAPTPTDDKEICTPLSDGQTSCLKADGQHCATSSKGNQYCWTATETGEKKSSDSTEVQRRVTGTKSSTQPLTTAPPVGETYNENNSHTVVTNTAYTVTNYSTTNNYNSGNSSTGVGGTTGSSGTSNQGEISNNSVTGTGACGAGSAWICSGGDASNCAILLEEHEQKCLQQELKTESAAYAEANALPTTTPIGPWVDESSSGFTPDGSGLGFARTCPSLPELSFLGSPIEIDIESICTIGDYIGAIVLMLAAVHALFIIGQS